ncbi:hypothetical protein DSO57_1025312 [Entomophthora muscae]|uniref:Uncharacterized protein n=1 Tax=Entomophthora muscae TaxID=34485 RepID=A0ACC2S459_9FUNG|nr:hypothetical protein DSO57_1025312 [Entomophthora muscae]
MTDLQTSSAYKDDAISSSSGQQSLPPVFVVPLPQKKLLALTAQSLLQEHHNRTSLRIPNETPLHLQDARLQMKMHPGSNP